MNFMSRPEEMVLLAVWRLRENAYCVPIRRHLNEVSGREWSFGAVYDPLDRLEKKGMLVSSLSEPTRERGGRSKRIYKLTPDGLKALIEIKKMSETIWDDLPELTLENL